MDDQLAAELHETDLAALGRRMRDRRLALSMTQGELAASDVTIGYISRIESGQRRPDARLCEAFADRLGTTAAFLITGVEPADAKESQLSLRYAALALESGEAIEAERLTKELLEQGAMSQTDTIEARYLHARALEASGEIDRAILELQTLLDENGWNERRGATAIALSRCLRESGDLTRAIEVGETALSPLAAAGAAGTDEAIQLTVTVAFAYFVRGDTGHAVRLCQSAIANAEKVGSTIGRASAYWNASIFASGRGDTAAAIPLAERALALLGEGNDARNLARLRLQLGIMLLRLDPPEYRDALARLRRARKELKNSSANPIDLVRCDIATARGLMAAGEVATARGLAERAADDCGGVSAIESAEAQAVLGQLAALDGDDRAARTHFRRAVALLTGIGADREAAQLWLELGSLLEAAGDQAAARDAFRSAAVSTGLRLPAAARTRV